MNRKQRGFVVWALLILACFLHVMFCEWEYATTPIIGCGELMGTRTVTKSYGTFEYEWGLNADDILSSDNEDLLAVVLGMVLPGAIVVVAGIIRLGGETGE